VYWAKAVKSQFFLPLCKFLSQRASGGKQLAVFNNKIFVKSGMSIESKNQWREIKMTERKNNKLLSNEWTEIG